MSQIQTKFIADAAITPAKLGSVTDGVTLDQSGSGSTIEVKAGGISNTQVNAAAAIAYSKLALSNSIVNADINSSAAIAYSKLALSNSIVNADINASAAIAYSKLNLSASIVNADIATAAAIARSKLASGTAFDWVTNDVSGVMSQTAVTALRAVATDANGLPVASATTATELGYVNGVTSSIQAQIDAIVAGSNTNNKETFVLSGTDITNQYIDLAQVAKLDSVDFMVQGAGSQLEGASYDYSVDLTGGAGGNTRITAFNDLATGGVSALVATDVVQVQYEY